MEFDIKKCYAIWTELEKGNTCTGCGSHAYRSDLCRECKKTRAKKFVAFDGIVYEQRD